MTFSSYLEVYLRPFVRFSFHTRFNYQVLKYGLPV